MLTVLKSIYLPYLILGSLGWFLIFFQTSPRKRHIALGGIFCLAFMFSWRLFVARFSSSRYGENMLVFFVLGSSFFLLRWPSLLKKISFPHRYGIIKLTLILIALFFFVLSFFHHNPYREYIRDVSSCIKEEGKGTGTNAIVCIGHQYIHSETLPQFFIPDQMLEGLSIEKKVLASIYQKQFQFDHIYLIANYPPKTLPPGFLKENHIKPLASLKKNNHRKFITVYSYHSIPVSQEIVTLTTNPSSAKSDPNLLKNPGFEQQHESSYIERMNSNASLKGVVPENGSFPRYWSVLWASGFAEGHNAKVYTTKENAISGQYSLKMSCKKDIDVHYTNLLDAGTYRLECDLRPIQDCVFGIQLSLRTENGAIKATRTIAPVQVCAAKENYRYTICLTNEMFYPFPKFFLHFVLYNSGEILLDNFNLTKM